MSVFQASSTYLLAFTLISFPTIDAVQAGAPTKVRRSSVVSVKSRTARITGGRLGRSASIRRASPSSPTVVSKRGFFGRMSRTSAKKRTTKGLYGKVNAKFFGKGRVQLHERFRLNSQDALSALESVGGRSALLSEAFDRRLGGMLWGGYQLGLTRDELNDQFKFDALKIGDGYAYVRLGEVSVSSIAVPGGFEVKVKRNVKPGEVVHTARGAEITSSVE